MANYANQLTIKIQIEKTIRHTEDNSKEQFSPCVYWKYKKAAMKKLTGNGYKLWEYLFSWTGKDKFDFSPKRIIKEIGISDRGIRNARQELKQFGCLTLEEGKKIYIYLLLIQYCNFCRTYCKKNAVCSCKNCRNS